MASASVKSVLVFYCAAALFNVWCTSQAVAQTGSPKLEQQLLKEPAADLAAAAVSEGDVVRGAMLFHHSSVTCVACHSLGDRLNAIGPDLTKLDPKPTNASLVESLLEPSKVIAPAYRMITVETTGGMILRGVPVSDTPEKLVLRDASQPQKLIELKPADIAAREPTTLSMMPAGQVNLLADRRQFLDLVRYLIEVRDGGPPRAREIERSLESLVREFPDKPLPNRPVVQRGEVAVNGGKKYPRGVAIGFSGGTVLFDADQLTTVALWHDGFVKSTPGNYFGVFMQSAGSTPYQLGTGEPPLTFKLPGTDNWQTFEAPLQSDPNTGTRFEGYQVGRDSVRLHYRIRVGAERIQVTEDIHAELRPKWHGWTRAFRFTGLPPGSQVALNLPRGQESLVLDRDGVVVRDAFDTNQGRVLSFKSGDQRWLVQAQSEQRLQWAPSESPNPGGWQVVSTPVTQNQSLEVRLDFWKPIESNVVESPALRELLATPTKLTDLFDEPIRPAAPLPQLAETDEPPPPPVPQRPAVTPKENSDEFTPTTGRFLRFVVTGTNDQSAPGIDELEVYGADPTVNLALKGKASASTVISGYPIHQIKHLNDGKLGNPNSWISAENNGGWAQIELPEAAPLQKIVWARDRTGVCADRLAIKYRIEVSTNGTDWTKVGDESGRAPANAFAAGAINKNASPGYEMESIPLPFPGCRPSDVVFTSDGTLYALAMTEGQVWRTRTPPAGHSSRVHWQRYASGLYHPVGLAVVNDRLYVAQKPEITELIDRDGDGTVDHYRTLATGWGLSTGWHEYCFGLAVDAQQNLWFALNTGYFWTNPGYVNPGRWRGSVLRVSTQTGDLEEMAKGCRVPNGVSSGASGDLFFTDNQGDWIQACKLAHIVPGRFYGHPEYKEDALPKDQFPTGRSAIWFPYHRMRSISGPIYDATAGKFGPFADQMFVGDVGYGANAGIMRVALEKVDGEYQGACFPFVDNQPLGCERMRFGPDYNLYIASLTSGLTRMKYVAETAPLSLHSIHIRPGGTGFVVQLTKPLAADQNLNPAQFAVKQYHYLYTGNYGSPQSDEKPVPVTAAELSADRRSITLTLPVETYPIGMVYEFRIPELRAADGEKLLHKEAWYTVHRIPNAAAGLKQ